MWTPIMGADTRLRAVEASAYLPDPRAEHYWDLWRFTSKVLTDQLKYSPPEEFAWDMLVMYKPHLQWREQPPEPTLFMQARDLKIGVKWDTAVLKAELQKWVQ